MQSQLRKKIPTALVQLTDAIQPAVIALLSVVLLWAIALQFAEIFKTLLTCATARIIEIILSILVSLELLRLVTHLRKHEILEVSAELAVVSVLREIIVHGTGKVHWETLLAVGGFLLAVKLLIPAKQEH